MGLDKHYWGGKEDEDAEGVCFDPNDLVFG
jgi:hypothetical protein